MATSSPSKACFLTCLKSEFREGNVSLHTSQVCVVAVGKADVGDDDDDNGEVAIRNEWPLLTTVRWKILCEIIEERERERSKKNGLMYRLWF